MANKCKKSFREKFYNKSKKCLYDVLEDGKVRPNQLFALSLSYPVLDVNSKEAKEMFETVTKKLLNKYGLNTLAKGEETLIANGTGVYYVSNSYLDSVSSLVVINYNDAYILGEKDYRIKYRVQESKLYATALLGEDFFLTLKTKS